MTPAKNPMKTVSNQYILYVLKPVGIRGFFEKYYQLVSKDREFLTGSLIHLMYMVDTPENQKYLWIGSEKGHDSLITFGDYKKNKVTCRKKGVSKSTLIKAQKLLKKRGVEGLINRFT